VSPKLITRPNTIVSDKVFALECDVDDPADDVGCAAQIDNSPKHDRAEYVCTLECYRVGDVGRVYETNNSPNTIVSDQFLH
jgi:hypothetical protein